MKRDLGLALFFVLAMVAGGAALLSFSGCEWGDNIEAPGADAGVDAIPCNPNACPRTNPHCCDDADGGCQ